MPPCYLTNFPYAAFLNDQELGKTVKPAAAETTKLAVKTADLSKLVPELVGSQANDSAWEQVQQQSRIFGSANLRTFPVSMQTLEQRTGLTAASLGLDDSSVDLDDFKYATLYVAGGSAVLGVMALAFLPPNIGATICYLVALIPIVFLGVGSTAPQLIANAIASIKGGGDGASGVSQKDRICRHEAAHFCCGYWCGLPIQDYSTSEGGNPRVEFGVTPSEARGYSATQVAALAVTSLAGSVGEALAWGTARGAAQDLMALQQVFGRASDFYGAAAQQDVTRWAALTATLLLKQNAAKYEQVAQALQRNAPVEECVRILET